MTLTDPHNDRPPQAGITAMAIDAIDASRAILTALPPAFIVLVLLNIAFLGMVLWFLTVQIEQRTTIVGRVIDVCIANIGKMP